ncbi:hypothetical protein VTI28DRAFT_2316 [Corynascus sepedonium]
MYAVKLVSAAPGAAEASTTNFSFAKWVEDIIPNPDTASTVDEAIAAANAANVTGSAGGLQARAPYCDPRWDAANGRDAAACVDDLATKSRSGQNCIIGRNQYNIEFCRIGAAKIVGSKAASNEQSANW